MTSKGKLPKTYTTSDVAKLLRVHPTTILRKIHGSEINAFRVGRKWLISQEEYNRLKREKRRSL